MLNIKHDMIKKYDAETPALRAAGATLSDVQSQSKRSTKLMQILTGARQLKIMSVQEYVFHYQVKQKLQLPARTSVPNFKTGLYTVDQHIPYSRDVFLEMRQQKDKKP